MTTNAMRAMLGGAAMVLTVTVATGALAQAGQWGNGRMGPGYGGQGQGYGFMGLVDLNDDGRISDEEAAAAADAVFVAMDADDDGQVTKEEYMAVRMGPGPGWNEERQAAMQARKEARFAGMDADKDGMVSREEFMTAAQAHHKAADTDGDGVVTPWEHRMQGWF